MSSSRTRDHKGGNGKKTKADLVQELKELQDKVDFLTRALKHKHSESALLKYRLIFDVVRDIILVIALDGKILDVNESAVRSLGYSRGELLTMNLHDLRIAGDREELLGQLRRCFEYECTLETVNRRKDGSTFHVEISTRGFVFDGQNIIVGVGRDVSEHKRVEEALRDSEEKYRTIVETAGEGIWILDGNYVTVFVNARMAEMMGYSVDELIGKSGYDFVYKEDLELGKQISAEAIEDKKLGAEFKYRKKDGSPLWAIVSTKKLFDDNGKSMGSFAMFTDITERKRSEELLRESEDRERERAEELATMLDAVPTPVIIAHDPECTNMTGNRAADELMKLPRDGEISLTAPMERRPHHYKAVKEGRELRLDELPIRRAAKGEDIKDFGYTLVFDDGTTRELVAYGTPLRDRNGSLRGAVHTLVDVTERKRVEMALLELMARAEQRSGELDAALSSTTAGVMIYNQSGKVVRMNDAAYNMIGLSASDLDMEDYDKRNEVIGHCKPDGTPLKSEDAPYYRALHGESITDEEVLFMLKDREPICVSTAASPIRYSNGEITGAIAIFTDITERKRMENALRESEEKYRTIVETAKEGIWSVDVEGRTTFVNNRIAEILGASREEMLGKICSDFMDEEGKAIARSLMERRQQGIKESHEFKFISKNGSEIWTIASSTPILDKDGKFAGSMSMLTDITERKRAEEALNASNLKISEILASIQDDFYVIDHDWNFVYVSKSFASKIGKEPKDLVGNNFWEMFPKHLGTILEENYRATMDKREIRRFELPGQYTDGWYRMTVFPSAEGITLIGTDITELKNAEEERKSLLNSVQTERDKLSTLVNSIPDEVWYADMDKQFTLANPSALREFGLLSGVLDIEKFAASLEVYRPDGSPRPVDEAPALRALNGEVIRNLEEIIRTPATGKLRNRQVNASPVRDASGNVIGSVSVVRDITDRKRAEEVLQEIEARRKVFEAVEVERRRLFDVLETMPAMVCLLTADYHIAFANRAFRDKFGEDHGRHCYEYCFGVAEPCEFCESYNVLKTGQPHHWEVTGPDGSVIEAHDYPFTDADGSPLILEMDVDITERKRAEAVLRDMNEILERRVAERIAELNESKMQAELYLDLMGHDISNMHQIAMGQLELANEIMDEEGGLKAEEKELIETPLSTLNRSARLIENVRKLQCMRRGEFKEESIDLNDLLSNIVKEHEFMLPADSIKFVCDGPRRVMANKLLHDVFSNLIGNAIKHSDGNGVNINIRPETASENGKNYHKVSVEDTGPGVPDDMKDRVFNRLQRGDTKARGLGLGLYIVNALVESYHGKVWVEDRVQGDYKKGSRFVVLLPALEDSNGD